MPATSSIHPQMRQSRRSRSSSPYPLGARSDTGASHPLTVTLQTRPSDTLRVPVQDTLPATTASRSRSAGGLTHPEDSTGCLGVETAARDPSGKPSQLSLSVTETNVVDSSVAPELNTQGSVVRLPAHGPRFPNSTGPTQSQHSLWPLAAPSQQSRIPEQQNQQASGLQAQHQNQGLFYQAHNFSATGSFIDGDVGSVVYITTPSNQFMEKLLKATIPGAAADSSARDPPPRCHPGTRLAILERCLYFITHCNGEKKMRWVVGAAGVGKSAVMQNVAESPQPELVCNASVFFSINGRNDGTKAIMTLSYQFAAKSKLYRRAIEDEITNDPSLLQSSMPVQFEKLIVQPFIHNRDLNSAGRVLTIIDGLDECKDTRSQVELLRLISNLCISYPCSPIVWLIASRPEPHIAAFFSRPEVEPAYETEEIAVDCDEARADVERFLRHELAEIGRASDFLGSQWPDEPDLWKLAEAVGGLFAYAHTVVRYIGDLTAGDPVSQLSDVLNVIDELPLSDVPRDQHPMAQLDALYARILSNVPGKIMMNVRKLLLLLASDWDEALSYQSEKNFIVMCNWLGMTADEAYAAVNRLRSVLYFPRRHETHKQALEPFHKSVIDYMSRSGFSTDIELEAQQLKTQCAFRILEEAPSGIDFCDVEYVSGCGMLARNGGTGNKISITWRADGRIGWDDNDTRLIMYKLAIGEVVAGMKRGDPVFRSESCVKLLTTRFQDYDYDFPYRELCGFVFDQSRCRELMRHGVLKQIPAKAIGIPDISAYFHSELQFHRPVAATTLPDPWNSSCWHERVGQWEQGKEQNWTTAFNLDDCPFCIERLERQFDSLITWHPDHAGTIMFTSTQYCCVELRFVDPEDDVSEWTYWVWLQLSLEQRKQLGSTI